MARRRGGAAPAAGAIAGGVLAAQLALAAPLAAQRTVAGGFEDASLPVRGEARLRFGVVFEGTSEQFGGVSGADGSTRVPLGARFSFDSAAFGASHFALVGVAERALRDSVGVSSGLTLGVVNTGLRTLVTRIPFQLDLGLTRRLALSATLPVVRTRSTVNLVVNPGGTTGNLGFNPANAATAPGGSSASAQQNALVQKQLAAAASALESALATCPAVAAPTTTPQCAAVIANRTGAAQLAHSARAVAHGLAQVYGAGTTAQPGGPFVPIQGTEPQRAVEARLRSLGTAFAAFQVTDLATPAIPAAATARIAAAGFQRILTEERFGVVSDSVKGVTVQGTGDLELGANAMWLDTFGGPRDTVTSGLRIRSTVGAGYRLATGSEALPTLTFFVPTGNGPALLFRSATDVAIGRRAFVSAVARVESPLAHDVAVSVPLFPGELFAPGERELIAQRTSGRTVSVEIAPRWTPNDAFSLAAQYAMRSRSDDKYVGTLSTTDATGAAENVDASMLGAGTGGRAQLAGFGITYSTLGAFARGHSWLPAEVSYLHTSTFAGSGGVVPRTRYDQLMIRVYAQIFGTSPRRPAPRPVRR